MKNFLEKVLKFIMELATSLKKNFTKNIVVIDFKKQKSELKKYNAYDVLCEYLINIASSYVGVTEEGGDNKGAQVELFQKAVDGVANGESWCLCFIQYCVKKAQEKFYQDFGIDVKTILYPTEHVLTLWNKTDYKYRLKEMPHSACIILWQHYVQGKPTNMGHAGIIESLVNNSLVKTIEGNTSASSNLNQIERNGDGVYYKIRHIDSNSRLLTSTKSMKLLGFLMAWDREALKDIFVYK
jgi:hypothetical protein